MILFFLGASKANELENPIFGSSSRDEMVQIAGYGEERLSTVLITGSVHCEACLHEDQLHAWPISGAMVAVNCHLNGKKRKSSLVRGFTDEYGDFTIDLPSELHATPKLDKICAVKVLHIPKNSACRPTHVRRHKELKLSSVGNGIRTYDAGSFRFQHLTSTPKQACARKGIKNAKMLL
ncbi:hypothetical protein UlMin_017522 [Ulmus minor]